MDRDYDLIRMSFDKFTTKINLKNFDGITGWVKSQNYKKYNQAFFEEILIDYNANVRIARNYRERFLVTSDDIYLVLKMYAHNDYIESFLRISMDEISHLQF